MKNNSVDLLIREQDSLAWLMPIWVLCRALGIPTKMSEPTTMSESTFDGVSFDMSMKHYRPSVTLNGLHVNEFAAVIETIAEAYPSCSVWPDDPQLRAVARDICFEVAKVCGYISENEPFICKNRQIIFEQSLRDRIVSMAKVSNCFGQNSYMFGSFCAADAAVLLLPVFDISVSGVSVLNQYLERLITFSPLREWLLLSSVGERAHVYRNFIMPMEDQNDAQLCDN